MSARVLVNGTAGGQVSVLDRGLAYGDGLFESVRLVGTEAPLWSRHMQRLTEGCARLCLPVPDVAQLWREVVQVAAGMPQSVVRVTLTRGIGERGYAPPIEVQPTRVVAAFPMPLLAAGLWTHGVHTRLCSLRLAEQPLLAGLKHLNRLEQVLARAEWNDPAIAEGVLRDREGRVISATMANLFALVDGVLLTPSLDRCGVAGVARAEVLAACPQVRVVDLTLEQLLGATEIFLSSSVRGIVPVQSVAGQVFRPGAIGRRLQQHWCDLGFSMERVG